MFYRRSPKIQSLLCATVYPRNLTAMDYITWLPYWSPLIWVWKRGDTVRRLDDESKEKTGVSIFSPTLSLFQAVVPTMSGPIHHENSDYPLSLLEISLSSLTTPFSHCPHGNDLFLLFVSGYTKFFLIALTLLRPL